MFNKLFLIFSILIIFDIINYDSFAVADEKRKTNTSIDFDKAKSDIISNIQHHYHVIQNLTDQFKQVWRSETERAAEAYRNFTRDVRWYFVEPEDKETFELDKALAPFFPFGGNKENYIDTSDKINDYCNKLPERIDSLKSWIRRKYRFNIVLQVSLHLLLQNITEKNEYYCANRDQYVRNIQKLKELNNNTFLVREKLVDTAIYIQNSTTRIPRIGRVCCAWWEFKRTLINATNALNNPEAKQFALDMVDSYFGRAAKYFCFLYPEDTDLCEDFGSTPKVTHNYKSLIIEMVVTIGKILSLAD